MSVEKCVHILYGSQTGNAEFIAQDLNEKCKSLGIPSKCATLNSMKKVPLQNIASAVIIICSTTGNGDSPENSDAFWRTIKLRSAAKDTFTGIRYSVLGLGDTNYDKFCHMGKAIDKRFEELGAQRFMSLACADEATNMEEIVEVWKVDVIEALQKLLAEAIRTIEVSTPTAMPTELPVDKLNEAEVVEVHSFMPNGVLKADKILELLGQTNISSEPPELSSLPRSKSTEAAIEVFSELALASEPSTKQNEWDANNAYTARVKKAVWLTSNQPVEVPSASCIAGYQLQGDKVRWGESKRVVHMEISLGSSGIVYSPGDSVGICCPNPQRTVDFIISRINESSGDRQISLADVVKTEKYGTLCLSELLTYKVDLVGIPKKAALFSLSSCCTNPLDQHTMQWLCSKDSKGKLLWQHYIEEQRLGIAEILFHFESCRPTLQTLLSCLTPLAPRYYSIASSPLLSPSTIAVAFSLVRYTCGALLSGMVFGSQLEIVSKIDRRGLCTGYLEGILTRWLDKCDSETKAVNTDATLRIFHKPSIVFKLPGSVSHPLILIGPGTGIAPFVGFLEHRSQLEKLRCQIDACDACTGTWRGSFEVSEDVMKRENSPLEQYMQNVNPGPIWLFFGCRDENDYLYKDVLEKRLTEGTLTCLQTAFSRVGPNKVYVSHKIREHGEAIVRLLLESNAYLYICGDGNRMAKDVHVAIVEVMINHGGLTAAQAEKAIQDMKLRRRFVLDIWS